MSIPTKKEVLESLAQAGITGQAAELLARQGGRARHEARVQHVKELLESGDGPLCDAFVALLDMVGIGGHAGLTGYATQRIPDLASIPSKHAGSGPAWDAAIRSALSELCAEAGLCGTDLHLRPNVVEVDEHGDVCVDIQIGGSVLVDPRFYESEVRWGRAYRLYAGVDGNGELVDKESPWLRALAGLAVSALVGQTLRNPELGTVFFDGFHVYPKDLPHWASIFNACEGDMDAVTELGGYDELAPIDEDNQRVFVFVQ